jgi:acetyltransferase-like isoleucine patch superfamily enzyme
MKTIIKSIIKGTLRIIASLFGALDSNEHINKLGFAYRSYYWGKRLNYLGDKSEFHKHITINGPHCVSIGNNVAINSYTHIWGHGGVSIGDNVMIASHVAIISVTHDPHMANMRDSIILMNVKIEDDVWIGSHSVILPGITIGKGSVIGAASVITKDVPPNTISIGVPSKVIKKRRINDNSI